MKSCIYNWYFNSLNVNYIDEPSGRYRVMCFMFRERKRFLVILMIK